MSEIVVTQADDAAFIALTREYSPLGEYEMLIKRALARHRIEAREQAAKVADDAGHLEDSLFDQVRNRAGKDAHARGEVVARKIASDIRNLQGEG